MRNKIQDLNNHLFAQLERLGDEELTDEELQKEIERSKAISQIASQLVESSKVQVQAMQILDRAGYDLTRMGNNIIPLKELKPGQQSDL